MTQAIQWDGGTITEPGVYTGIPLELYHNKLDLLDAPSVSKSSLKNLFPSLGGSPKAFWHQWAQNPNRIEPKTTTALNLGKAVHALLLGDEVFSDGFAVQPETYPDAKSGEVKSWNNNANYCKAWVQDQGGKVIVTNDQIEKIRRIAEDAAGHPLVQQGILNGSVERSLFIKDAATGLWFKSRPDNEALDGFWADLKTTSSMDERFIQRQLKDNGYFIQGAGVRMACRELGLPFETFANVYVCTGDTPDTQVIELSEDDLDLGEALIRHGLDTIHTCRKSGIWPGARPYEGRPVRINDYAREVIEADLKTPQLEQAA
ncbi:PD-(D/E)XK nuclease-like domain-containing protein [Roseibium sediminis]|uniref:PD-(D/E)XK nuclease-like domain-containing protein n=1 Tax=Roseibium sediminis TaxID=1775174 RepID=UPI00123CFF4B|nr:PD-(D/E)XK nuclease-like domain-containing protein [Roseibium sediminis]